MGAATRKHSKESVSLEECCQAIIEAMKKGKRELIIPTKLKALPWLNLIDPRIVEYLVSGAVEEQGK